MIKLKNLDHFFTNDPSDWILLQRKGDVKENVLKAQFGIFSQNLKNKMLLFGNSLHTFT